MLLKGILNENEEGARSRFGLGKIAASRRSVRSGVERELPSFNSPEIGELNLAFDRDYDSARLTNRIRSLYCSTLFVDEAGRRDRPAARRRSIYQ